MATAPGDPSKGGGGETGPTAAAGSGGGTSCDQTAAADTQTASDRRKEICMFMEGGLHQILSHRERPILGTRGWISRRKRSAGAFRRQSLSIWDNCDDLFQASGASYVVYATCSSRLAYDGSSGSLARNFSNVRVAPVLPMVTTETVVVLLTACADLRLVSKERQLS